MENASPVNAMFNCAVGTKTVENMRPGCAAKSGFVRSWHKSPTVKSNTVAFLSYAVKASNLAWDINRFKAKACLKSEITVVSFLLEHSWYSSLFIVTLLFPQIETLSLLNYNQSFTSCKFFPITIRPTLSGSDFFFQHNILNMEITGGNDYNTLQNQQGLWYALLVTDHKSLYLQ